MLLISSSKYIITEALEKSDVLETWRWKVGLDSHIIFLTRNGDAMLKKNGEYFFLDTGSGEFQLFAHSDEQWNKQIQNSKTVNDLLLTQAVDAFVASNGDIPPTKSLGFKMPPIVGGSYSPENRYVMSAVEHFSFTGSFHKQIADLPDGTPIRFEIVE